MIYISLQNSFDVVNFRSMERTSDILSVFRKFAGFKLLEFFLFNPGKEFHLKEIARRANLSPSTVKFYGELFLKFKILEERKAGNQRFFRLNSEDYLIKRLKTTYGALLIKSLFLEEIAPDALTIAAYGGFVRGEFDRNSDLDVLVIGDEKALVMEKLRQKEEQAGLEIEVSIYPFHVWDKMKKESNPFVRSVLENHIIIKGEGL